MNPLLPKAQPGVQAVLIALLFCCIPASASAALLATMQATGETQGAITNESTVIGREGLIEVVEFGHSFSQPIDNSTGQPAGDRQHRAVRLIKAVDLATPKLLNAMINRENLTTVIIRFYRPGNAGQEVQFYTVELRNAYIVNVAQNSRTYADDNWNAVLPVPANETLTITYEKIIWTWEEGGVATEDNWAQGQ